MCQNFQGPKQTAVWVQSNSKNEEGITPLQKNTINCLSTLPHVASLRSSCRDNIFQRISYRT
jgi:hypothetical protein